MRVVTLEEHFYVPSLVARIPPDQIRGQGNFPGTYPAELAGGLYGDLADMGSRRVEDMDRHGITMQVLSWNGPGAELLHGDEAIRFAGQANDALATLTREHPDRFVGLAHLPLRLDDGGAGELNRCVQRLGMVGGIVNGTTDGRFLDDRHFEPLLAAAESLGVPLYIHPGIPPAPARDAYYSGLDDTLGFLLSTSGFGWHMETAVHLLRLVLSGALERHPGLKLIVGHMGEAIPFMLARIEARIGGPYAKVASRTISEQLRQQVWVTTSGFFTLPPLQTLLGTFGIDRVLFSVDYPYSGNAQGQAFLDALPLAPADVEKIRCGNADELLGLQGDRSRSPGEQPGSHAASRKPTEES